MEAISFCLKINAAVLLLLPHKCCVEQQQRVHPGLYKVEPVLAAAAVAKTQNAVHTRTSAAGSSQSINIGMPVAKKSTNRLHTHL